MPIEIIYIVVFIIMVYIACILWNKFVEKHYSTDKRIDIKYSNYLDKLEVIKLQGIGNDENGDYEVARAIKKIKVPYNLKVKV